MQEFFYRRATCIVMVRRGSVLLIWIATLECVVVVYCRFCGWPCVSVFFSILIEDAEGNPTDETKNIVYKEIISWL
jgi:hypothetical protein